MKKIDDLCRKYPALQVPMLCVSFYVQEILKRPISPLQKHLFYESFKANISCIGLEPEEYETCIRWFCEIMEY